MGKEIPFARCPRRRDRLIVRSGDKIPTDGKILKGSTTVDESMVTGESKTVEKTLVTP